jgi:hypothetical protein
MHGDRGLRPERYLEFDVTNMENFPLDCTERRAAAEDLSDHFFASLAPTDQKQDMEIALGAVESYQ